MKVTGYVEPAPVPPPPPWKASITIEFNNREEAKAFFSLLDNDVVLKAVEKATEVRLDSNQFNMLNYSLGINAGYRCDINEALRRI